MDLLAGSSYSGIKPPALFEMTSYTRRHHGRPSSFIIILTLSGLKGKMQGKRRMSGEEGRGTYTM